jgi:hypothetical protein
MTAIPQSFEGCKGIAHKDGKSYPGYLKQWCKGYCTFILDTPISDRGDYRESIYLYTEGSYTDGSGKHTSGFTPVADIPGSECDLLPLSCFALDALNKRYTAESYAAFREGWISSHTTWETVKKTVTCEYHCKHQVDTRVPVRPKPDDKALGIAYLFDGLARYAQYQRNYLYQQQNETWNRLASKLSLGALAAHTDYTGLDPHTAAVIAESVRQQYRDLCCEYKIAIFGENLPRYLKQADIFGGGESSRNLNDYLKRHPKD